MTKIIGSIVAGAASLAALLWGVPYYIDAQVDARFTARMEAISVDPGDAPAVVANTTRLDGLAVGQARIESKVDAFASQFTAYLEREASR